MVAAPVRRASAHDPARARRSAALLRAVLLSGLAVPAVEPAACGRRAGGDAAFQRLPLLADRGRGSSHAVVPHRVDADPAVEAAAEPPRACASPEGRGLPRRTRRSACPAAPPLRA